MEYLKTVTQDERLASLEERVSTLEATLTDFPSTDAIPGHVSYEGDAQVGERVYSYSWSRPTSHIMEQAWDDPMKKLAASAHPLRGRILHHLLAEPATVATLVDSGVVSSTGTAYHHLAALDSAGWIEKSGHGLYSIKPARVVALLTLILAMEEA